MRKTVNTVHLEGRVYEHDLVIKTVQNKASENFGKEFISGTIDIAVDEDGTNIVTNHFTFVTPTTKKGSPNATFTNLKKIIDDNKTWLTVGKDEAQKIEINTALAINDFYNRENEHIAAKRCEGGFVSFKSALKPKEKDRNTFTLDMIISGAKRVEENPERNINEHVVVKGGCFDFRGAWLPIELIVENADGMDYFEGLEASNKNPIFTQVWGTVNGFKTTISRTTESAFGAAVVKEFDSNRKVWLIDGARTETYEFGEDITAKELEEALQNREVFLAEKKKRDDEYRASIASTSTNAMAAAASTVPSGEFNF